jgi:hypothetical protein
MIGKITAVAATISTGNASERKEFRVGVIEVGIRLSDVFPLLSAMWRQSRIRRTETEK